MPNDRRLPLLARIGVRALGLLFTIACAVFLPSCGPRMYDQPSLRTYKQQLPPMPSGTTPTKGRAVTLAFKASKVQKNPVAVTKTNIHNGRIFYGYYCLMCHGEKGDGNGPVGQSYTPKPTDLSSPAVTKLSDGQLYSAMLTGVGHEPVMIDTVLPNHRWTLVLYVRTLSKTSP